MKSSINLFKLPEPYEPGTIYLWSDEYIASNVIKKHFDREIDSGSRKGESIKKIVRWLSKKFETCHAVLDIGCGPGLYAELLHEKGFDYTGIDISPYQIEYAKKCLSIKILNLKLRILENGILIKNMT